jgi:hypothetical protein
LAAGQIRHSQSEVTEYPEDLVVEALRKSAAISRDRRVVLAWLPWVAALLAEAHLALGERTEALAAAREGIDRGPRRWLPLQ